MIGQKKGGMYRKGEREGEGERYVREGAGRREVRQSSHARVRGSWGKININYFVFELTFEIEITL